RRASWSALPLPSAGVAPLPRYYGEIRHPRGHCGRSAVALCFRYSSRDETAVGFPSSFIHPSPGMPCALTPADPRRSRHDPRLVLPSRKCDPVGIRFLKSRGSIASLALWPARRPVYASRRSSPPASQDSVPGGWLGLAGEGIAPSRQMRLRLGAPHPLVIAPLRTGEALALQWGDIDFEARTMHVRHTLQRVWRKDRRVRGEGEGLVLQPSKTRTSKQKLPMPEICVRALRAHRARQLEERLAAGLRWAGTDFVFTTTAGKPLHAADVMDESFRPTCERAGIPYATRENLKGPLEERGLRFYDLRHSCASLLIAQGVPLKVIQEILRHANIRTTSDRYTHLVPQIVGEALAAMDRSFLGDAI